MRARCAVAFALVLLLACQACPVRAAVPAGPQVSVAELGDGLAEKYRSRRPSLWGEHLPGVVDALPLSPASGSDIPAKTVALTLDACDGGTDTRIIALLREHRVPATVFATSRWLRRNMAVAKDLAADPLFTLACHGKRHKPASVAGRNAYGIRGTRTVRALVEEVEENAREIAAITGERPRWYRSGTAYYDDVAIAVIHDLQLAVAGYTVSADAGATLPAASVARNMRRAPDGAIILCHLNHPECGTFQGLARAIPAMLKDGAVFTRLPE